MAQVQDFMVAIELGSTRITGIAGRKNPDGSLQVLAMASEPAAGAIRKGVIYNLDKTTQSLKSIHKRLEATLKWGIGKVYVGIGGQSLRTTRNTLSYHFDEETKISHELIDQLLDNNRDVPIIDQEILEVAPQEYKVGNNLIADPVGVPCTSLEGRFLNLIARSTVKKNIEHCFEQANWQIADYLISPLTLADTLLTASEKRSGCVLVDMGADTTTLAIYKNNILRHLAVIPLGGSNITRDICSQQLEEDVAEELKCTYGCAYTEPQDMKDEKEVYKIEGKGQIEARLMDEIVEARVSEIIANVWNQIRDSGYEEQILAGAILTGGGSMLNKIDYAFSKFTNVSKVRMARESAITLKNSSEVKRDGSMNTLLGLVFTARENCGVAPRKEQPSDAMGGLFGPDGESAESERQRRLKEQEERRKQEAEARQRVADSEALVKKAAELKAKGSYKEALNALDQAEGLKVAAQAKTIQTLRDEIKQLKKGSSLFGKIGRKLANLGDELISGED
jgi:cell division protein FtsA